MREFIFLLLLFVLHQSTGINFPHIFTAIFDLNLSTKRWIYRPRWTVRTWQHQLRLGSLQLWLSKIRFWLVQCENIKNQFTLEREASEYLCQDWDSGFQKIHPICFKREQQVQISRRSWFYRIKVRGNWNKFCRRNWNKFCRLQHKSWSKSCLPVSCSIFTWTMAIQVQGSTHRHVQHFWFRRLLTWDIYVKLYLYNSREKTICKMEQDRTLLKVKLYSEE